MLSFSHFNKVERNIKKEDSCLRINLKEEPSSLDPRRSRNMSGDSQVHAMLFEGLFRFKPNGKLVPAQAASYELSSDRMEYTFHLKETFWSDATPVTAYDFEKTWKDILDPSFPSVDAHVLFCVKNARAAKKGEMTLDEVGIDAVDAKTLKVRLEAPTLHFLSLTASSVLFPINQTKEKKFPHWYLEASQHFVCNGPFKLSLWVHHNELVLEKNKYYHQANKIRLDSIHISMVNHGMEALNLYASGLFDVMGVPLSCLPFDFYRELIQKNLFYIVNTPGTVVCMFNTRAFPFYNVHMRKAFSYALNRQHLIDTITLLKEQPALGVIPPMLKKIKKKPFFKDNDIAAAELHFQKGLEELGITREGLYGKLKFSFWKHDHGCPMLPQALQKQWREKLGVDVQLEALDFKTLHEKGRTGLFSMGYFVFLSLYCSDSIEILDRFKYAQNARNYARWENESYTQLLDKAVQAVSEEESEILSTNAEAILLQEMPFAPIFHWNYALLVQPYIKGFAVSPLGYLCFDRITKNTSDHCELNTNLVGH
jgi:oligopeptide transport system substrate-binding protein